MQHESSGAPVADVLDRRYVRVLRRLSSGCVLFEFALGDPDTTVEMVLPAAAFTEFCAHNHVVILGEP